MEACHGALDTADGLKPCRSRNAVVRAGHELQGLPPGCDRHAAGGAAWYVRWAFGGIP